MKIPIRFLLFFYFSLLIGCTGYIHPATDRPNVQLFSKASEKPIELLWQASVAKALNENTWDYNLIYDASHFLMVPMHFAFCNKYEPGILQFSNHFTRFLKMYKDDDKSNDKARLQYFYLLSRYTVLAREHHYDNSNLLKIVGFLENQVNEYWLQRKAWHWDIDTFKGIKERLIWKLQDNLEANQPKYLKFIFDEEKYIFCIAADLATFKYLSKQTINPGIVEILNFAYSAFKQRVYYLPEGGWLFQPGYLDAHPDYAYTGYKKKQGYSKKKNSGFQAEDCSHSFRYPLELNSLEKGFNSLNDERASYFADLRKRLNRHFEENLYVTPSKHFPYYGTKNFMDGSNGLYMWRTVDSTKKFSGYGPYELSYSFLIGWWGFLGNEKVNEGYRRIDKDWSKAYLGNTDFTKINLPLVDKNMLALIVKICGNTNMANCI